MYNRISKALIIIFVIAASYCCNADSKSEIEDTQQVIKDFNAWSSVLDGNYSYDLIKKKVSTEDYIIVAKLSTHPVEVEAFIVVNEENSTFHFISSEYKQNISCVSTESAINLDLVSEQRLSEIDNSIVEIHPFYTIVEKRKNGITNLFTFKSYHNLFLRREIDMLEGQLLRAMLINCSNFKIE